MTNELLSRPPVHALLADGTTVCIRPVMLGDHNQLQGFYEEMSPENLRLRFFAASRSSAALAAERACAPARPGYRALLAEANGRVIGLAEYDTAGDKDGAELSVAVADSLHHRGVGTLLVEHLVSAARTEGITTFTADALSENHEVLRLFADLGLRTSRRFEGPEVRCTVHLDEDDTYLSAVEARGRSADMASLRPLLRPDVVAVVGAGRTPGSVGRAILHHLHTGGFTGRLFAVNPGVTSVLGVPSHPSVAALPKTPDLVIVAVPAAGVPAVAEECGRAGVHALVVVTAGLDHTQAQALLGACRTYGMRLVGPNCLGISNTDPELSLDATFAAGHRSAPPRRRDTSEGGSRDRVTAWADQASRQGRTGTNSTVGKGRTAQDAPRTVRSWRPVSPPRSPHPRATTPTRSGQAAKSTTHGQGGPWVRSSRTPSPDARLEDGVVRHRTFR